MKSITEILEYLDSTNKLFFGFIYPGYISNTINNLPFLKLKEKRKKKKKNLFE